MVVAENEGSGDIGSDPFAGELYMELQAVLIKRVGRSLRS